MNFGDLFAGIGGISLGLEQAGMSCSWQVEYADFPTKVLEKHWPNTRRVRDVRDASAQNLPPVDLIAGGFPCTDLSNAQNSSRKGIYGEESGLVFEFARIARELKPNWLLIENVPAVKKYMEPLQEIFKEWELEYTDIKGSDLGAYTRRVRTFIVGHLRERGRCRVLTLPESGRTTFSTGGVEDSLPMLLPWKGGPSLERLASCLLELPAISETNSTRIREGSRISRRMDGHRYLALGNSVPVPVIKWIGEQILREEKRLNEI